MTGRLLQERKSSRIGDHNAGDKNLPDEGYKKEAGRRRPKRLESGNYKKSVSYQNKVRRNERAKSIDAL